MAELTLRVGLLRSADIRPLRERLCAGHLLPEERVRLARFTDVDAAEDFLAGRVLLRRMLNRRYGRAPQYWRLAISPAGRPYLPGSKICFSLSHSGGIVACALRENGAIGVDLQVVPVRVNMVALVRRWFSPSEAARLAERPDATVFLKLWTLREAYLKALGTGLTGAMRDLRFGLSASHPKLHAPAQAGWSLDAVRLAGGFWLAVALPDSKPVRIVPQWLRI